MKSHVMTARRKAALRKAQLASARKRRKGGRKPISRKRRLAKVAAIGAASAYAGAATLGGAYFYTFGRQTKHSRRTSMGAAVKGGAMLPGYMAYSFSKDYLKKRKGR